MFDNNGRPLYDAADEEVLLAEVIWLFNDEIAERRSFEMKMPINTAKQLCEKLASRNFKPILKYHFKDLNIVVDSVKINFKKKFYQGTPARR